MREAQAAEHEITYGVGDPHCVYRVECSCGWSDEEMSQEIVERRGQQHLASPPAPGSGSEGAGE